MEDDEAQTACHGAAAGVRRSGIVIERRYGSRTMRSTRESPGVAKRTK
jgi:hypothetical protein